MDPRADFVRVTEIHPRLLVFKMVITVNGTDIGKTVVHRQPTDSKFDLNTLKAGRAYSLNSVRRMGEWYLLSSIDLETNEVSFDRALLLNALTYAPL